MGTKIILGLRNFQVDLWGIGWPKWGSGHMPKVKKSHGLKNYCGLEIFGQSYVA